MVGVHLSACCVCAGMCVGRQKPWCVLRGQLQISIYTHHHVWGDLFVDFYLIHQVPWPSSIRWFSYLCCKALGLQGPTLILLDFLVLRIWTRVLLLVQHVLLPAGPFSQPHTAMKSRHFPYSFCRQGKETSSPWSARPDSWILILNLCWIYISRTTLFRLNQNTIQQIEEWNNSARSAGPSGFPRKQLGLFMKQVATSLNMSPSLTDKLVPAGEEWRQWLTGQSQIT